MMRFGLVLLLAVSAYAAPQVGLQIYNENEVANNPLPRGVDGGLLTVVQSIAANAAGDLINSGNRRSQALGLATAIATIGGGSTSSCAAAQLINAYRRALESGDYSAFEQAKWGYIQDVSRSIDIITSLASNAESNSCSSSSCGGFAFEEVWGGILGSDGSSAVYELYCIAKRMNLSYSGSTRKIAEAITAASIPQILPVFEYAASALNGFYRNPNPSSAASAKQALRDGLKRV